MTNIVLRQATEDDIDEMYDISCSIHLSELYLSFIPTNRHQEYFKVYTPTDKRKRRFRERITSCIHDNKWYLYVIEVGGQVAGYTLAMDKGNILELKGLFVSEKHQGRGLGKQLFLKSLTWKRQDQTLILQVVKENYRAQALYEKYGLLLDAKFRGTFYGAEMIQMYKND